MTDPSPTAEPGIVVSGQGAVAGTPDIASISLGVSVKRGQAPAAMTDAAAAATRVLDALKAAGIADSDLQTRDYALTQEFAYLPDAAPRPDGFRVTNTVVATVRTPADAGTILDAAVAAGGDDAVVQGISFGLGDDAAAKIAARDLAFADARAKAEQLARLSGRTLGRVVSINETSGSAGFGPMLRVKMAYDAASTPIQAGEIETTVTVDVRWAFDD